MSKRRGKKERKAEERIIESLSKLGYACPDCGGPCDYELKIPDGRDTPDRIDIICGDCGRRTAVYDETTERWTVSGRNIPFLPYADDNAAALYQRFDPSEYGDEESAVREEMALLDRLCEEYMVHGYWTESQELSRRKAELIKKMIECYGPREDDEYIRSILKSDKGGELDDLSLKDMIDVLISEDTVPIDVLLGMKESIAQRMVKLIAACEGAENYLYNVIDGYELFERTGMNDKAKELLEKGYSFVKEHIGDEGGCDDMFKLILCDYIERVDDREDLKEAMCLLERICDPDYAFCESAVFSYVQSMFSERSEHDHLVNMLSSIIEGSEREIGKGVMDHDVAADAYLLRYDLEHGKGDLLRAADHAVECISSGGETAFPVIERCLNDVCMDRSNRSRLVRRLRSLGYKV